MSEAKPDPLKIAGVPEAYNDPFQTASFDDHGVEPPTFCSHPGGSGSMLKAVIAKEVDVAFALTDCIVAAIENGSPVRLAGPLIHTSLTWAIVVAPNGPASVAELESATWGISRVGSGSHVMAQVLAKQRNWPFPKFQTCGHFENLRTALGDGTIDAFLWEHFTTKPYSDSGEVRIIGGVPTPWPCFSIVVRKDCSRLDEIRGVVDAFLEAGKKFLANEASVEAVALRHGMKEIDAKAWLESVRYAEPGERTLATDVVELTRKTLFEAGVIKSFVFEGGINAYYV